MAEPCQHRLELMEIYLSHCQISLLYRSLLLLLVGSSSLCKSFVTKFSETLRDVIQNFNLAAIYDAKVSNSSASLQKTPISDLNVDETHIAFVKLSEKRQLFLLLDMCDM